MSPHPALLGLALTAWIAGADAESYLVLPLIGDQITIVSQERQVGSHTDRNRHEVVPQSDANLDHAASVAAESVLRKARPDASITIMRATDPKLYSLRNSWVETDAVDVQALLALVAKQSAARSDDHLLLIMPFRATPDLKTGNMYRGTGKVAGLGFYVDRSTRLYRSDTLETATGFLGVFANFELILINLQSNAIDARERLVVGTTFAASQAADRNPWSALSLDEKDAELKSLLTREIERVLPKMLMARQP